MGSFCKYFKNVLNFQYELGEGAQYMTRMSAQHKLQLHPRDFRRICILKGVYPREPKNRRRAQRGNPQIKILYHKKDINFLLHDKLVWQLRDMKIMNRRIKYADSIKDSRLKRMRISKYPELSIDHCIRERYPTFIDAVKDLDDCLTLLFLFSTFPALKAVKRSQTALCRRLTVEFMHYVIATRALRKVFVSIKGYYFQAEIKGELVTWIVPHYYPYQPQAKDEVDFNIMSDFTYFYSYAAGFINYRLYQQINLVYPPQFNVSLDSEESQIDESTFVSERIAALNVDLLKTTDEVADEPEEMDLTLISTEGDSEKIRKMHEREQARKKLKNIFQGLKFFINREVPREPLVFTIRSFGGKVSWDKNCFVGGTFDEDDETITHQIIDRPSIDKKYISRDYIQPQWVFDTINQGKLLPTNKYFMGVALPPHLSPFIDARKEINEYVPPEEKALRDPNLIIQHELSDEEESGEKKKEPETNEVALSFALENAYKEETRGLGLKKNKQEAKPQQKGKAVAEDEEDESEDEDLDPADLADMLGDSDVDPDEGMDEDGSSEEDDDGEEKGQKELTKEELRELAKQKMAVKSGKVVKVDRKKEKKFTEQESKLMSKMVKPRHKRLYYKLLDKRDKEGKEIKLLETKRKQLDEKRVKKTREKKVKA